VSSLGGIGILADNSLVGSAGIVDVSAGKVSGTIGVEAINNGTGPTSVATTGPVTGTLVDGIIATGNDAVTVSVADAVTGAANGLTLIGGTGGAGNINVTGTGGFFGGTGDGANIKNNGSGTVTVDISGASGSTGGNGIVVRDTALGGDINVTTGAVTTPAGSFNGIDVFGASNNGNVAVVANGDVHGGNAGIVAGLISTSTGNVDVTANGAVGGAFGVDAENYGTGNVTVTTIGPITATTGYGVVGLTGSGDVVVNTGNVSSTGAAAILAEQIGGGAGTVGVTAGNVSGTRGIIAQTNGAGAVSVNALGNVTATNGNGIEVINFNPAANAGTIGVSQAAGTKITATNGAGIYTDSGLSTGMTTITVAGEITAGTAGFAGVYGTSTKGGITVDVTGTGKIDPDYGIDLATVDGPLVVNNAGLVTGTIDGIRLVATGTGSANISNTGTITGDGNAVLISVNNTPSTLFNSGTINGAIKMFGTAVATSNWINGPTGIANLTGVSSISGNLVNGGNVNLGAGGTLTILGNTQNAGRVSFAGAGSFTTAGSLANSGIINAQNNLSGNVVTVGGNYTGGGQFFADYSPATVTADRLNIAGSASGNTNVTMNLAGARAFVPGGFLPVVTVAGAVPANAFTSSTVFATTGFVLDSFGQNPSNAHQFGLIQTVNLRATGLGNLSYMAESASGLLDDPISPFVTNRTDAGGTRFSLWMRGSGGHSTQTISSSLTGVGLSYSSTSRFRTSQHAAQIGGDVSFGGIGGGWKVNVGVMGGWYGASAPLAGGERVKVEAPFVGGYAVVGNGAFELEGNIRKEWRHYTVAMPSLFGAVGTQRMDGDATAGSARISYRIGTKIGFAATPFASFNYGDTKIDPLAIDASTVWTAGSDTTKIGQAGLRLSYRGGSEARATFEPFISAARMENWSRGDSSSFAFGAPVTTFSLQTNTWKSAMRYSAGILANAHGSRVSGFVVGNIDDDSRLRSFTIHAGLRFNF
jgi:outer membrane autotransporter protein